MKKLKKDLLTILEMVLLIFIYLSISGVFNSSKQNTISIAFPLCILIALAAYKLWEKIQYRRGKTDYLLLPTKNDQASKYTAFALAGITIIAFIVLLSTFSATTDILLIASCGFITSVLAILNGMYHLPKGRISVKGDNLMVDVHKIHVSIPLKTVEHIEITNSKLVFTDVTGEKNHIHQFDMDEKSADAFQKFITNYSEHIVISNSVQ